MNGSKVKGCLREWLRTHNKFDDLGPIPDDQDLILHRVVDSLQFVEFVLYIEELSGRNIDGETIDLEQFRTLANIWQSWFACPSS